jgi:hypothetical protein
MNLYLDESGDLGWTLDKPYQAGGSSRYLTIATLIIPKTISHKALVRNERRDKVNLHSDGKQIQSKSTIH